MKYFVKQHLDQINVQEETGKQEEKPTSAVTDLFLEEPIVQSMALNLPSQTPAVLPAGA